MKKTSVSIQYLQYILHIRNASQSSAALWMVNSQATFKDKEINIFVHIFDQLLMSLYLVHWNARNPIGKSKTRWWLLSCCWPKPVSCPKLSWLKRHPKLSLWTNRHRTIFICRIDGEIHFTAKTGSEVMAVHLNCVHVSKDATLSFREPRAALCVPRVRKPGTATNSGSLPVYSHRL